MTLTRALPEWISRLLQAGVRPGYSTILNRKIRAANAINLFLASTTAIFAVADIGLGEWLLASLNLLSLVGYLGVISLNHFGFHSVPRLAIMFMTTSAFVYGAHYFGPGVQIQTGFFAIACLPFVLFDMSERLAIFGSFLIPVAGYFAIQIPLITFHQPLLGRESMFAGGHGQSFMTFVLLGLVVHHFRNANAKAEKKLEDTVLQLEAAMKKLELQQQHLMQSAKMSALGEMAGGIAHEVNNPLAVILLNVNSFELMLKRPEVDTESLTKGIQAIKATIQKITTIINGLRFFAREGSLDPFEMVSLKVLIQQVLSICGQRFRDNGIRVELVPTDEFTEKLEIHCQPVQISQIMVNLLSNAFDAVMSSMPSERWVRIGAHEDGDKCVLAVTDSGSGVPVELRKRIFEPFFTSKPVGRGTGLGLSVSKGIAEAHGGHLLLDEGSANTRFVLRLPRHRASTDSGAPSLAHEGPADLPDGSVSP